MDIPPFSRSIFANTYEWKRRTLSALESVDSFTSNKEIRMAAGTLRRLLLELEPANNYVSVEESIPVNTDPEILLDCLRGLLRKKNGVARLTSPSTVEVQLAEVKPGGTEKLEAREIIKTGFKVAEFIGRGSPFCEFKNNHEEALK